MFIFLWYLTGVISWFATSVVFHLDMKILCFSMRDDKFIVDRKLIIWAFSLGGLGGPFGLVILLVGSLITLCDFLYHRNNDWLNKPMFTFKF